MKLLTRLRCGFALARNRLTGGRQPLAVNYAVTNRCPWRCAYCKAQPVQPDECDPAAALRVVSELAAAGCQRLHLTGGEPLLRPDLGALIASARRHRLFVTLATSGIGLADRIGELADLDLVFLSLDGPREVHDRVRGAGAYDAYAAAAAALRRAGKKFWLTAVITRANRDHLGFLIDIARQEQAQVSFHLPYCPGPDAAHSLHPADIPADLKLGADEVRAVLDELAAAKRGPQGRHIGSSPGYLSHLRAWPDYAVYRRAEPAAAYRCFAGRLFWYVDANADLYPCCDTMDLVAPRNLLRDGFAAGAAALERPPCASCLVACYCELNLMFSLTPGAIRNWNGKL